MNRKMYTLFTSKFATCSFVRHSELTYFVLFQDVSNQVLATLYDYPSLKTCEGLHLYAEECVRLAWALSVQTPPYILDFEAKIFDPTMHTRFHASNPDSLEILNVLWPALLEGDNGPCVNKGVVLT